VTTWIVDDTGFLKQGSHSVGVQRQYTGSAGKVTNCQIGVSLSVASRTEHVPIDFALYLPKSWCTDSTKRAGARIPDELTFKTKPELALDLVARALDDELPGEILLADAAYGTSVEFRNGLVTYGLDYAVGVNGTSKVWDSRCAPAAPWGFDLVLGPGRPSRSPRLPSPYLARWDVRQACFELLLSPRQGRARRRDTGRGPRSCLARTGSGPRERRVRRSSR